ncbi:MAG TPA: LL-diaminopimelate aminotransferase [bacterium]|nr:LL-diaminopimelate aminotransferase [bacterium]
MKELALEFERSRALRSLPPYLFIEIDRKKKLALAAGVDLVDLGVGDPDRPTPPPLIRALQKAAAKAAYHQYPLGSGMPAYRQAVADWFKKRFKVSLDPASEVLATIGSKEAIGHFPIAFVDPGDVVLCPDPGYPVYAAGARFVGAVPVAMPLLRKNKFLPDFGAIDKKALKRARLMWLNYPNNPTAATCDLAFFRKAVAFCRKHSIILAHDMAYSEVYEGKAKPPSVLQVEGARDIAIEFHSLSKTFNMTGWRVGFAVGKAQLVAGLAAAKGNLDSGVVSAIQEMGIAALRAPDSLAKSVRSVYARRREILVGGLKDAGFEVFPSRAAFYVWIKVPAGRSSAEFCGLLLEKAGIVATPGNGFGAAGEGYFRLTLTAPEDRLRLAVKRLSSFMAQA